MNRQAPQQHEVQLQKLRDYLRRKPEDGTAWLALAGIQQKKGRLDDAAASAERALRIHPANPTCFGMLAEIGLRQRRFDIAIAHATQAIRLDKTLIAARAIRAEAFRQDGNFELALADFMEVKNIQPDNPQLLNKIGTCLVRLENFAFAKEHFERAIELNPRFTVARLNLGLLCATQLKSDEAVARINKALEDPALDGSVRRSAQTTVDILVEHRRLQPFLDKAVALRNVDALQIALGDAPAALLQPDEQCVNDLGVLAALCSQFPFDPEDYSYSGDTRYVPFINACGQCQVEWDAEVMAALYARLTSEAAKPTHGEADKLVLDAWLTMRDRLEVSAAKLLHGQGEAWLRYWHARLLNNSPEKLPGQFKAIPNTVGVRKEKMPVLPEHVPGTIRSILTEIRPTVPEGVARGVFMYTAICMIHAFSDGNGRLARFLLAWEFETSGMAAIVIPVSLQVELRECLDKVLLENDLGPMAALLINGHAETNRLLIKFNDINIIHSV